MNPPQSTTSKNREDDDADEVGTIGPPDAQVGAPAAATDEPGPSEEREPPEEDGLEDGERAEGDEPPEGEAELGGDEEDEEDEGRTMSSALGAAAPAVWIALVAVVVIAASLLWMAGEQHYQSCVDKVSAQTSGSRDPLTNLVRARSLKDCSRLPF